MRPICFAAVLMMGVATGARAQEALPIGTPVGGSAPASGYDDGGRRDPFVSGLAPKKAPTASSARPKIGLAGVAVADIAVKGVVHSGGVVAAVLEGPGGKSFVAHSRDRLQDAVIKNIEGDTVVFTVQVVDAGGVAHARDVRKSVRAAVGGAE